MNDSDRLARRLAWLRLALLGLVIAAFAFFSATLGTSRLADAVEGAADAGWSGYLAFVVLYALATVLMVPGTASTVTAGLVYGGVVGGILSVVGATLGAAGAYLAARGVGRQAAESLLGDRSAAIDRWLSERQFRSVLVLRLLPVVPFNLLNYGAGLSSVGFLPFVAATAVGIVPATFLIAALGDSARQPTSPAFLTLLAATLAVIIISGLAARRWSPR